MRRSVAVVIFLVGVLAGTPSFALAGGIGWGLRGGWSGARLDGDNPFLGDLGPDLRHGATAGAFAHMDLVRGLAFQPEVAWVRKGGQGDFRFTITGMGQTDVVTFRLQHAVNWIEVPLMLRWEMPIHPASPYLILGPTPAWRVGSGRSHNELLSWTTTGGPSPTRATAEIFEDVGTFDDYKLPATSFDLGLGGGLGIRAGHGPVRFALEARYTHGLLDVHPSDMMKIKNQVFAVTTAIELR